MTGKTLPQIVNDVFVLLDPLESDDRRKVVASVMTLLGENAKTETIGGNTGGSGAEGQVPQDDSLGPKVTRWMKQNSLTTEMIDEVFHRNGDQVEVISGEVPGGAKRKQTQNCYLIAGVRGFLETDDPSFTDADATELCKHMGCYDLKNHATNRNALGNSMAGSKDNGFTLPAPGLRAAGELVKQMSATG